jgi:hypothetical protein
MIIQSERETHRATLTQEDDGVRVLVERLSGNTGARWTTSKQLCNGVIEAPWHVVADYVAILVQDLEDKEWESRTCKSYC